MIDEINGDLATAKRSIATTRREHWVIRILARLCVAGAMQMVGDLQAAFWAIHSGFWEMGMGPPDMVCVP